MITPIANVDYTKNHTQKQKMSQKNQSFGQITYFIEGTKPVVCSQKKEASLLKRFHRTLKTNSIYNQGPQNYKKNDAATHILTNNKGTTMLTLDENYGEKGKHVLDINTGHDKENTTVFIYEDKENSSILDKIRQRIKKLRERDNTFSHIDANA